METSIRIFAKIVLMTTTEAIRESYAEDNSIVLVELLRFTASQSYGESPADFDLTRLRLRQHGFISRSLELADSAEDIDLRDEKIFILLKP